MQNLDQLTQDPSVLAYGVAEGGTLTREWTRPGATTPLRQATRALLQGTSTLEQATESPAQEAYMTFRDGSVLVAVSLGKGRYAVVVVRERKDAGRIRRAILSTLKEEGKA